VALDAAGFVCPPADLVNAIISLARGKCVDAGIDFVAAVPWLGDQIKASHMAEKAGKKAIQGLEFTYKAAGNAADAVDTLKSGLKGTLDTLDSMMGAQREFAVVGGLTMSVDDFWDAGKTLDRFDDTADLVKNARNYADGIDNFRDGSKIVNNLGDTAKAGSNAADVGKAVENATDGLKAADQAKYLDDGLDMAAGGDSKYIYRGKDVSPDLEVKVNVVDEAGNVVDTYSNAAKNIEGPGNFNDWLMREGIDPDNISMNPEQFQRIKEAFEARGGLIIQDADAQALLNYSGAQAATLDGETILLRPTPTASDVFEELIHSTQYKNGTIVDLSNPQTTVYAEIEAAEKLIRNRAAYNIPDNQTIDTIKRTQGLINDYNTLNMDNTYLEELINKIQQYANEFDITIHK